jgi:hypothetical protein
LHSDFESESNDSVALLSWIAVSGPIDCLAILPLVNVTGIEETEFFTAGGFPAVARGVLPDASVAADPVAGRAVRLAPALLVARSWLTTGRDAGERRRLCQRMDRPAAVQSFDAIHDSGDILGDGQIAAPQFFQCANPMLSVVDGMELVAA